MPDDAELLRRYLDERSETAFTELVRQHLPHVYATALRRVGGDTHLAEDVAQQVFTALARKAATLRHHASLGGWLYLSTHLAAAAVVRAEQRRKTRETKALTMETPVDASPDTQVRSVLDEVLVKLKPEERDAIVLRFFQQRSLAEVGTLLRVSEDAARKRVDRALEKLRAMLASQGVTSTTALLGATLAASAAVTISEALSARIAGHALATGSLTAGETLAAGFSKLLAPLAAALFVGAALVMQHQANATLRREVASLAATQREVAALQRSNQELAQTVAKAETERAAQIANRAASATPSVSSVAGPKETPAASALAASTANYVVVHANGTLSWGGKPINLDEFLVLLRKTSGQTDDQQGGLLIETADRTQLAMLKYVMEEVRKIGISRIALRTNSPLRGEVEWFKRKP